MRWKCVMDHLWRKIWATKMTFATVDRYFDTGVGQGQEKAQARLCTFVNRIKFPRIYQCFESDSRILFDIKYRRSNFYNRSSIRTYLYGRWVVVRRAPSFCGDGVKYARIPRRPLGSTANWLRKRVKSCPQERSTLTDCWQRKVDRTNLKMILDFHVVKAEHKRAC